MDSMRFNPCENFESGQDNMRIINPVLILALPALGVAQTPANRFGKYDVQVARDVVYARAPVRAPTPALKPLLLDLYVPAGPNKPTTSLAFVAIHGGGLERGDKGTANMVELCEELSARGFVCVSINYRTLDDDPPGSASSARERTYAAAVEDAGRAVAWLQRNGMQYGVDPKRITIGGSSAGAAIALRLAYEGRRANHGIRAVFSWMGSLYGSDAWIEAGEAALFILHGADDSDVPVIAAERLARRATQVDVPYELHICRDLAHNVPLDRRPDGVSFYERLSAFLYRHSQSRSSEPAHDADLRAALIAKSCPH